MDWVRAAGLAAIVIGAFFTLSFVVGLLAVLLVPALLFLVITGLIWFLLQVLKEDPRGAGSQDQDPEEGRGEPRH